MARTIAIGDIHGCDTALTVLLNAIAPARHDTIVTLGDVIDRGPNSAGVLELLLDLMSRCRLVPLIGNHELMMFSGLNNRREFDFWLQCGGSATMQSYGGDVRNIPQSHLSFLGHCLRHFETENHFFVHANYDWQLPFDQQVDDVLFWQHIFEEIPPPHVSGKTAIIGHTPQSDGTVRNMGHAVIIDTGCYGELWLTALDVETGHLWQTNNRGQLRELELPAAEA